MIKIALLVVTVVAIVHTVTKTDNPDTLEVSPTDNVPSTHHEALAVVSSDTLYATYQDSEVRGDRLYAGKEIYITGAVQKIFKQDGYQFMALWTANEFEPLLARIKDEDIFSIHSGQHVKLDCILVGFVDHTYVGAVECSL